MRQASMLLAAAAMALLTACSGLSSHEVPERIYILRAGVGSGSAPVKAALTVVRPVVHPGLDTNRIAVVRPGNELDYFAASRLGEPLPKVLAALALQSMSGDGGFATVLSAERAGVPADFEMQLTARRFEAEYTASGATPSVQVALDCLLVASNPRRVLGDCSGAATEAATADRMGEIIPAMERAAQKALAEVRAKAVALARAVPVR